MGGTSEDAARGHIKRLRLWIIALRSRTPWWVSILVLAVLGGTLFGLTALGDLKSLEGRSIEHAEVVAVDGRGILIFDGCGKGEGPRADVTWRSSDPPSAYPATFTDRWSCNGDVKVGETHLIVRSSGDDDPSVTVDPVTTQRQVLQMTGFGAGAFLVAGLIVQGSRAAWHRWVRPARVRRRNRAVGF
ncbi:hypothetical protein QI633_20700 [Nocardioides sp. QY071]|uniref:hypothetical protein n=1 Tax=Nocardioides sp. QY071 TaxID=3044187 RepID=UPI00249BCF70|nr:hypothetical protein [Nocardioides sp. QY071]WGY00948.1 hypothetical protein QI633_20700 [Nocardioides sp. QY071]